MLGPEEEIEECLLQSASFPNMLQQAADPAEAAAGPDGCAATTAAAERKLQAWAVALAKTAKAFLSNTPGLFPDWRDFDNSLHRCISLVQFVHDASGPIAEPADGNVSLRQQSFVQFVHWDDPARMVGRRLRTEMQRFVWKPPSRGDDDKLVRFFESGEARVVVPDVKAQLVKARGQFRTDVPLDVRTIVHSLSAAAEPQPLPEAEDCFFCQEATHYNCPLCGFWYHGDCCEKLVQMALTPGSAELSGRISDERVSDVARLYRRFGPDKDGSHISSLVEFDALDRVHAFPARFELGQGCCPLCFCVMQARANNSEFVFAE